MKRIFPFILLTVPCFIGVACAPNDPLTSPSSSSTTTTVETVTASPPTSAATLPEPPPGLRDRVELAIAQVKERELLTTNAFWTVFHGMVGLGPNVPLRHPQLGWKFKALDYICDGGEIRGMEFLPTEDGLDVRTGPQFVGQGHQDQFIAELAQWGMPIDREFKVQGKHYTFRDFVRHAKATARVNANQELSWTILILGQYESTNLEWTNRFGEKLRFEDLLRYELDQSIEEAACGGTHRLFDLCWVHQLYLQRGGKTEGIWKDVVAKEADYQHLARKLQNPDGSFSTDFFKGSGNSPDKQLRMNTTGHILEWLALSLSDEELRAQWVQDAVNRLAMMFLDIQGQPMESGTLYHAIHGLLIYYARVYDAEKLGENKPVIPLPHYAAIGKKP